MSRFVSGITGRVTFAVLAVASILFSAGASVGLIRIADSARGAVRDRMEDVLDLLEADVRAGGASLEVTTADGVRAEVRSSAGAEPVALAGELMTVRTIDVRGTTVRLVATASDVRLSQSLRSLHRVIWIAVPLAAIASAGMAGLATRRALRPVGAIADLAATIGRSAGSESSRVPVPDSGDEVERLAHTVNGMLDRIEAAAVAQRRFTSDAAHELRTPLMAMLGELEILGGHPDRVDVDTLERLDRISGRLRDRIDDLVLLATLDEGRRPAPTSVDLRVVVTDECAPFGVTVEGDSAVVSVDEALIRRAVANLVANARRHAIGEVVVSVEVDGSRAQVHVDDDGPGIPEDDRARVFERFARIDESRGVDRGGSGLGLSIVASIAAACGGGASVGTSPLGGARVSFWVPTR